MRYLAVAAGAMLGANLRYAVANWAAARWGAEFPYGTLIINVSGAFVIGFFLTMASVRFGVGPLLRLFFVTGFLGGYTTFSSYTWEALTLLQAGAAIQAVVYVLGRNIVGLAGVWLGAILAQALP